MKPGKFMPKKKTPFKPVSEHWDKTKKELEKNQVSKKPNPLEKVIEAKVCEYAKSLGILHYKFTSPARRSVPDRMFILPNGGRVFFIEFKRKGCTPSPSQAVEIEKIRNQGSDVFVVDDVEKGKMIIRIMLGKTKTIDDY